MTQGKYISGNFLDFQLLRRILRLAIPFKRPFIIATVLAILLAIIAPIRPWLIQLTVDKHILGMNVDGIIQYTIILIGLLLVETIFRYQFNYLTSWLGQSVIQNLRVQVFEHIIRLRLRFFDRTPIGTATTRTINDVETINDVFSQGFITIIADLLTLIAVLALMFYTDWRLTLVSLSTFPFFLYGTYLFKEGIKKSFNEVRTQVAKLNAFLQEHISGMKVIQIFGAGQQEMERFMEINDGHRQANIRAIWYYSVFFPVVEVILASAIGLMVWYGANQAIRDQTSIGTLIAFILYLNMLFRPLRMLADKFNTLQMGIVAGDRVFRLLDTKEQIQQTGNLKPAHFRGEIEFRKVWFAYEDENYVLKDISFSVNPGQTLAIVGATGSGKSSIINILGRYYEINRGSILVDQTDILQMDVQSLRSKIGMVLQDVFLFTGSVMDNIRLRNEKIPEEKVIAAAKQLGAHDFIMKLPGQYNYQVMERGATLSLGQRQLISFVRAIVYEPDILVLDEATSSVDTETEYIVQQAIEKMITGRTSIVIAHRLSTIRKADKILVLNKGKIEESGDHETLLGANGHYRKLYDMQFKAEKAV